MKVILGTKIGMTQIIGSDGTVTPITVLQAGPCTVTQVKTAENHGYNAVQVAYGQGKNLSKALAGHVKTVKDLNPSDIREFRLDDVSEIKIGDLIQVDSFVLGDKVSVSATSKGKGFAGTVKRHNFEQQKRSHGGNGDIRKPGSIGAMYPQKIWKGKRMAGRMGTDKVTVKNLIVAYIDPENHLIGLRGAVPGPKRGLVTVEGEN